MNYALLNQLKLAVERNWLRDYQPEKLSQKEKIPGCASEILYSLIKNKIDQIFALSELHSARLAIFIAEKDSIKFIAAFLAGVITEVNIFLCNPDWQRQEWEQVLNLVTPDLVFADDKIKSQINQLKLASKEQPAASQTEFKKRSHIMIPTGGTSGKIKFAIHTWDTLTASVMGFSRFFNCAKINSVCTLPPYHVSGLMQLMRSLLTEGNLIICPYRLVAKQLVSEDKSSYFISLVPTQLQYLIDLNPNWLREFKTVLVGGAPPRQSLLDTARKYNIPIALTYGMTETASGVVALKPQEFLSGNNSSGRILPHAEIAIDSQTKNHPNFSTNKDSIGLITISSTSLCLGYYPLLLSPKRSLTTDDLGYFNTKGYLHLVGRDSQKIITGGENVFPLEVEKAIYATNLVKDVCVIGIQDRQWGQVVTAIYVPKTKDILDLVKQQIRAQLAKYKQPKNWLEVDYIPRNNRGKINYQELKAIAIKTMDKISPSTTTNNSK